MADEKITALPENTTPLGTDIIPIVDDPGGSPINKKITISNLISNAIYTINRQTIASDGNDFAEISIPAGTYNELIIIVTGSVMNGSATACAIRFGNASIDTGTNYWYTVVDTSDSSDASATYINTTRLLQAYNDSATHSIVTIFVSGLSAGSKHTTRSIGNSYNVSRCSGCGEWVSADEILKLQILATNAGGWAANSKCTVYGIV